MWSTRQSVHCIAQLRMSAQSEVIVQDTEQGGTVSSLDCKAGESAVRRVIVKLEQVRGQ